MTTRQVSTQPLEGLGVSVGEEVLAELIFQHVEDSVTWCRLAQVSKRFNKVAERKLIRKQTQQSVVIPESTAFSEWTELPANGQKHGFYRELFVDRKTSYEYTIKNNAPHGTVRSWFGDGNLQYVISYRNGKNHGNYNEWNRDGIHIYSLVYSDGKLIETRKRNFEKKND